MRVWFVAYDEHYVCRNLIGGLVTLPLKGDLGPGLPARLHVDGQHLLLLPHGAVIGHHPAGDLHAFGHSSVDVLQGHVEVVFDGWILRFFFARPNVERMGSEGSAGRGVAEIEAAAQATECKGIVQIVHIVVVQVIRE